MRKKKKTVSPKSEPKNDALIHIPRKSSSGRKCSICSHEEVKAINAYITEGKLSFRAISCQIWGDESARESIRRHTENCLKLDIKAVREDYRLENAIDHYTELLKQKDFAQELQDAAKEWLKDPKTGRISFMPRAEELDIIYYDHLNTDRHGNPTRNRKPLQHVLDTLQQALTTITITGYKYDGAGMRNYANSTIAMLEVLLNKFALIEGAYKKDQEIEYELTVRAVTRIENIIAQQTAKNPDFKPQFYITKMVEIAAQDFGVSSELIVKEYHKRQPQQLSGI